MQDHWRDLLCGVLAAGTASAADWTGKGTLGGVLARGNTDMETINANIDVQNDRDRRVDLQDGRIVPAYGRGRRRFGRPL